ncbi:sperm-associated microtubule inner protein 4 [Heterodontus francisci]|uniref:sperm-associated microtubule inner protein 4 n=1 Tax=Heterodontus francisci TaxID=7792 RepID=UPI00355BFF8F
MEVDRLSAGDPFRYYRETEGYSTLQPTFQSSEQISPMQFPQRSTVSASRYEQYLENAPKIPRTPWGTEREYGGVGLINLPDTHRPKAEPPILMEKGHRHFGYGGHPLPSDVTIDQYYDLTQLKRSHLRPTDQLLPSAGEFALHEKQIRMPFPAEHPYYSHISKFAVFPNFISPDDPRTGVRAGQLLPINPNVPAKGYDVTVAKKIKGFPYRLENQEVPTEPKGLHWPGQEGYFHYPKSAEEQKQVFYPIPPKLVVPNKSQRTIENAVSERTANILKNIEKSHWLSTYQRDFTGSGPMNPILLDDYHDKAISKVTGKYNYFSELKEQSHPAFLPNPPLRPMEKKVNSNKVSTDANINYQCADVSSASPSIPSHDSIEAESQSPMCETYSKPNVEMNTCKDETKLINWKNMRCQTAFSAGVCCPYSDIHMLRYKVQQMKNYEKPSAFCQHQEERMMDCWATPVINMDPACRITDFEHAQPLWKRKLPARPETVQDDIKYIDLPQSKLSGYITKENHMALSKPPSSKSVENNGENAKCLEVNYASGDRQPIYTSCASENQEMFVPFQQPQVERGNMLICDEPKLQISKLKFPHPFNKTEVHKRLHEAAPEKTVDYRDNIFSGKKHTFFGLNSSYFHNGTF